MVARGPCLCRSPVPCLVRCSWGRRYVPDLSTQKPHTFVLPYRPAVVGPQRPERKAPWESSRRHGYEYPGAPSFPTSMNWHEYFEYLPNTGQLRWKVRPREHFATSVGHARFNHLFAGKIAGCANSQGYLQVGPNGKLTLVHVIIWEMHKGPVPEGLDVDHINNTPLDNRIENMQLATRSQNCQKAKRRKDNTSGFKGVSWNVKMNKWQAYINSERKRTHLGFHETVELAHAAYCKAALKQHGRFARTE